MAEYEYDGLHRRIAKKLPGQPDRHYYYKVNWQVVEERIDSGNPQHNVHQRLETDRLYVWGQRGPDDLLYRYRPSKQEVLQPVTDDNFNVIRIGYQDALQGYVTREKYLFDAYGKCRFEDAGGKELALNQAYLSRYSGRC